MSQVFNTLSDASNDRMPLIDFQPGQRFDNYLLAVRSTTVRTTQTGKTFIEIKLADSSDCRLAKVWDPDEADTVAICTSEFLSVTGQIETSEKYVGELKLNRWHVTARPADVTDFIQRPKEFITPYRKRFKDLLKSVKDAELHAILKQIYGTDPEVWRKFSRAWAAQKVHHAYPGGLLHHTVEVAELASKVCEVLPNLDRDLLVSAALLHDFGKMEEMDHELRAGEYTDDGCLLGHIIIGTFKVAQSIDLINASSPNEKQIVSVHTKRALMHLILSHHGLPEHGAAKKPSSPEAAMLWLCDTMSFQNQLMLDTMGKRTSNAIQTFERFIETYVYMKPMRDTSSLEQLERLDIDLLIDESSDSNPLTASISLPIIEQISAENPDENTQSDAKVMRQVVLPEEGADFLLHVTGDSMIDAGIRKGDLLFINENIAPNDGDIVLARIKGESQTIKYLRLNGSSHLEPANSNYPCVPLTDDTVVLGKVTGLLRDL